MAVDSKLNGLRTVCCIDRADILCCSCWNSTICVWRDWAICRACSEDGTVICWPEPQQHLHTVECDGCASRGACSRPASGSSEHCISHVFGMLTVVQVLLVVLTECESSSAIWFVMKIVAILNWADVMKQLPFRLFDRYRPALRASRRTRANILYLSRSRS